MAGGCRFEEIATDRAVDQGTNLLAIDSAGQNGFFATFDIDAARGCAGREKASLADAGHELEPTVRQLKSLVDRREPKFQRVGSNHFVGKSVT